MKKTFCIRTWVFLLLVLSKTNIAAQDKHDYNWLLGYGPSNPVNFFGGSYLNFNEGNVAFSYFSLPGNVRLELPCSISDADGVLQFYTSGCTIRNAAHQVMENGDNVNDGIYHNTCCGITTGDGYLNHNGLIAVPAPGHPGQYYLVHIRLRNLQSNATDLLYSLIDMTENNGAGKVLAKNQTLQWTDTLALSVNAVRHGNGRDWWIITENAHKSEFYLYLLDENGIHPPIKQTLENGWIDGHYLVVQCHLSPDGTRLVQASGDNPAAFTLYDIDRCSGIISNPQRLELPADTVTYPVWMCFSPSSRYLYVTNAFEKLYQFDLAAPDINASLELVGVYDDFRASNLLPTTFYHLALGPDNKIYVGCTNTVNYLHTINEPDKPGALCDFRQHNVVLPSKNIFHLPHHPNYRLYAAVDSPCDTLNVVPPLVAQWRSTQDSVLGQFTVGFTEYSYHEPVSWYWYFGDGNSSTERHPVHSYATHGTYTVCLVACNAAGVCDTLCRSVEVLEKISPVQPSGIVPGGYVSAVFPNPVQAELWIEHGSGGGQFSLYDPTGRLLLEQPLSNENQTEPIETGNLPSGLYIWKIQSLAGETTSGKVWKR